jgi:type II secretory pathway predicted ATPase ExeA
MVVVAVNRTMHTYTNTLKILCDAFQIDHDGVHVRCEKRLIEQAFTLNREGKMLATIIDEAHLLDMEVLRKLRLMFDDFPKNHNLILFGQTQLLANMSLKVNDDIKSRITYSTTMLKIIPDDMEAFLFAQLDKAGLGHNTFSDEAVSLIVRSADGILRRCRNLCLSCLLEAVRARTKTIGIDIVNRVLIQPHWRNDYDLYPELPGRQTP